MSHIRPYTDVEAPLCGVESAVLGSWVDVCVQNLLLVLEPALDDVFDVSLCFSTDTEVQKMNAEYRGKDKPTNVLSFPVWEKDPETGNMYLGDIIFAKETLEKEAQEMKIPLEWHVKHLVVHGLLHLIGYDHVQEVEAEVMEDIEVRILAKMAIDNPYL